MSRKITKAVSALMAGCLLSVSVVPAQALFTDICVRGVVEAPVQVAINDGFNRHQVTDISVTCILDPTAKLSAVWDDENQQFVVSGITETTPFINIEWKDEYTAKPAGTASVMVMLSNGVAEIADKNGINSIDIGSLQSQKTDDGLNVSFRYSGNMEKIVLYVEDTETEEAKYSDTCTMDNGFGSVIIPENIVSQLEASAKQYKVIIRDVDNSYWEMKYVLDFSGSGSTGPLPDTSVSLGADTIIAVKFAAEADETTLGTDTIDLITEQMLSANAFSLRQDMNSETDIRGISFTMDNETKKLSVSIQKFMENGIYALFYNDEYVGDISIEKTEESDLGSAIVILNSYLSYEYEYYEDDSVSDSQEIQLQFNEQDSAGVTATDFSLHFVQNGELTDAIGYSVKSFDPETNTLVVIRQKGSKDVLEEFLVLSYKGQAININSPITCNILVTPNADASVVKMIHDLIVSGYDKNKDGIPEAALKYSADYAEDKSAQAVYIQAVVQSWLDQVINDYGYGESYPSWVGAKISVFYDVESESFKSTVTVRNTTSSAVVWNVTVDPAPVPEEEPKISVSEITMNRGGAKKVEIDMGSGSVGAKAATVTVQDPTIVSVDVNEITAENVSNGIVITGLKKGTTIVTISFDNGKSFEIPVTINAITYSIETSTNGHGTIECRTEGFDGTVEENGEVSFSFKPASGYHIEEVLIDGTSAGAISTYKFENVASNHKVFVQFEKDSQNGGSSSGGSSSGDSGSNGSNSSNNKPSIKFNSGGSVVVLKDNKTCVISPDDGYYIKNITANGVKVRVADTYVFDKVSSSNKLVVEFAKITTPIVPPIIVEPSSKFTDINGHWAEEAIKAFEKAGYVNGVSTTLFAPDLTMTRGMFVTILGRMAGITPTGTSNFVDVSNEFYYSGYVAWAEKAGIASGVGNNMFAPDRPITREEMAKMVCNYLSYRYPGFDSNAVQIGKFADDALISSWAKDSVYTLASIKVVNGKPNNLFDPFAGATRAELVSVLYRVNQMF